MSLRTKKTAAHVVSKSYVVTAPSGASIIVENDCVDGKQARSLALKVFRTEDASLMRDDLSAKKVKRYSL
jgi:hypothetical protein